jgi:hypothetical protein
MEVHERIGQTYSARKALFSKGIRNKRLSLQEIERLLPPGSLTASERWLLYYSLRAAGVELVNEETGEVKHSGFPAYGESIAGH